MTQQLSFDLPRRRALGRGDFFVTEANALALQLIDAWHGWPGGKLVLCGPEGSGKTHLARVWAEATGAALLGPNDLASPSGEALRTAVASGAVCVEDVPQFLGSRTRETPLFDLHNLCRDASTPLLLTGTGGVEEWPFALPDLKSRIQAAQVARLDDPDDALLSVVLAKLFSERQIVPAVGVVPFLVPRMPRSFAAAARLVADIDRRAMGTRGGATLARAREALSALESAPDA